MANEDTAGRAPADAERGRSLPGVEGPATARPDNPGASGDWSGYEDRRRTALAPLQAQYDEASDVVRTGESGPSTLTEEQYEDARARRIIAGTNMRTTTPDFVSASGQFEPGDLEAWQRQEAAQSATLTSNNGSPLTAEQQRASFDAQLAQLPPDQRVAYWQRAANEYSQVRAGEVAQAELRRRLPGPLGEAAAQAYALGLIDAAALGSRAGTRHTLPSGTTCTTCNASARDAAPTAQPTPPGERRVSLIAPGTPLPAAAPALSTERVPIRMEADGLSARTGGALSAERIGREGVSATDLYNHYPEGGLTFHRGMRVERDPTTNRLQILEQRPAELGGERLQNDILNFSTDRATAEGFARQPGGNTFVGSEQVVVTTRPIPRAQALDVFHRGNFDPNEIEDGQVHPDKWDMRGTTRLPDVVREVQVLDPGTGQYRPARQGEVEWVPPGRTPPADRR